LAIDEINCHVTLLYNSESVGQPTLTKKKKMNLISFAEEEDIVVDDGVADPKQELAEYLNDANMAEDQDLLAYWKSSHAWPNLRLVARSYHAIPAAQTASERSFSDAGHMVSDLRSRLAGQHVNELLVMRSFFNQ